MTKRNNPFYPNDADYKTNSESYYEYLARINELIKELAEKIWEYEKELAENMEEIERVLNEVINKIGEGFNEEIEILLREWVEDGTLDHIINETLMNKKADRTELEALEKTLTDRMNDFISNMEQQMNEFEEETDSKFTQINKEINDLENDLNNEIENLSNDVRNKSPYHEIDTVKKYDPYLETDFYITHVKRGSGSNRLTLKHERITGQNKTAVDHARENKTSLSINAGMFGSSNQVTDYPTISNGIASNESGSAREYRHYLAIMENGDLRSYPTTTSVSNMINQGVKHATVGFIPMYENGVKNTALMRSFDEFNERHPRQIIAQNINGDYFVVTIGGRGVDGQGATVLEAYDLLMSNIQDITFAYNLDGGGSNQTVVRGNMINPSYSARGAVVGAEIRKRPDVLYIEGFEKVGKRDENIISMQEDIQRVQDQLHFIGGVQYGEWLPELGSEDNYREESVVYNKQEGNYIRLGNLTIAFYHLEIADKGTGTGIIRMRGLAGANDTVEYLASPVSVMDGFVNGSVFNPYFEQRGTGTLQLKALRTDGDDYVAGDKRTNEIVLGNYESMKDSFTMVGYHIFITDGNFKEV